MSSQRKKSRRLNNEKASPPAPGTPDNLLSYNADPGGKALVPSTKGASAPGETPPSEPKIGWLSEVAERFFGKCSDEGVLAVVQNLEMHDVSARGFGIDMPDLQGITMQKLTTGQARQYIEDLCVKLDLKMSKTVSKMPCPIGFPTTPKDTDERLITMAWAANIWQSIHAVEAKDKAKNFVMVGRISHFSVDGWKKVACANAYKELEPPMALLNDGQKVMVGRLERLLFSKGVTMADVDRVLKDRSETDESKKEPLGKILTQVLDEARARRTREANSNHQHDVDKGGGSSSGSEMSEAGGGKRGSSRSSNMSMLPPRSTVSELSRAASYTRDGSKNERKEQLEKVEKTAYGVEGFKMPLFALLNNPKSHVRAWTPESEAERKKMDPLMSLEGDEARFFEVVSSVVEQGFAKFRVRMVGNHDHERVWDARHMAYAFEAAHYDGLRTDGQHGLSSQAPKLGDVQGNVQGGMQQLPAAPHHKDFGGVDQEVYNRMVKDAAKAEAGGMHSDQAVQQLGLNMLRSGKEIVSFSNMCSSVTEVAFSKTWSPLARCYQVVANRLNAKWRGTAVSAFQVFLVLHLQFGRGANSKTDKLSTEFAIATFTAAEKVKRTDPLQAEQAQQERKMFFTDDGTMSVSTTGRKEQRPALGGMQHSSTHLLLALQRIRYLLGLCYGEATASRLVTDTCDHVESALQDSMTELGGVGLILQQSWAAFGENFLGHVRRYGDWQKFRHILGMDQMIKIRNIENTEMLDEMREHKRDFIHMKSQLQSLLKGGNKGGGGGAGGGGRANGNPGPTKKEKQQQRQTKREKEKAQQWWQGEEEEEQQQQRPPAGGGKGGRGKGGKGKGGKGKGGKGGGAAPTFDRFYWVPEDAKKKAMEVCGKEVEEALQEWRESVNFDATKCFWSDKLGIKCVNKFCPKLGCFQA
jgi:hypothetical protein